MREECMTKRIVVSAILLFIVALLFIASQVRIYHPNHPHSGATQTMITSIKMGLEMHKVDCGAFPTVDAGLKSLVTDAGAPGWKGPYLKHLPTDAWGQVFRYSLTNGKVQIRSAGPDMKFDTVDDITDK
jgi:general secretion pathway protein G